MEKRIGTVTLLIVDRAQTRQINDILSDFGDIILCRQGLPFHDRPIAVISLIVEGPMDRLNTLTGKIGRLPGVQAKVALTSIEPKAAGAEQQ